MDCKRLSLVRGLIFLITWRRHVARRPHSGRHTQPGQEVPHQHKPTYKQKDGQNYINIHSNNLPSLHDPWPLPHSREGNGPEYCTRAHGS